MRARSRLLLALVATTACGGGTAAGGGGGDRRATRLVYYERSDPRSLDPALSTDVPTGEMVTLAFDGLTQFDPDGRLLPALADRWTARRDGRRYVFHLRAGVRFHDGTPLTARAVRTSFLRVLSPASRGGRTWPLYPIAGAEDYAAGRASDVRGLEPQGDSAVAFTLREPLAIFPTFLAMPVASVVPVPVPPDLGQHPVGSGPWRFVAWRHDDELVFARNGDYWGGAPVADTLAVRIVPEALTRAAEFEAGRLRRPEHPPRAARRRARPARHQPGGERARAARDRVPRAGDRGAGSDPAATRGQRHDAGRVRLRPGGRPAPAGPGGVPGRPPARAVAYCRERRAVGRGSGDPVAARRCGRAGGAHRAGCVEPARGGPQGRDRHGDPRLVGRLPRRRQFPVPAVLLGQRGSRRELRLLSRRRYRLADPRRPPDHGRRRARAAVPPDR